MCSAYWTNYRNKDITVIRVELPALIGRLNDISRQALEASAALCISRQGAEITPAHLLFKLLETPFSDVRQILEHTGINHQQLQPLVGDSLNGEPQTAEPYPVLAAAGGAAAGCLVVGLHRTGPHRTALRCRVPGPADERRPLPDAPGGPGPGGHKPGTAA